MNAKTKIRFSIVTTMLLSAFAFANNPDSIGGQWSGNSQLDGESTVAKTQLTLGAPDSDNSMLRIEGRTVCMLKQGHYDAGSNGTWTLSFKEDAGGDSCARLAKGTFTLHAGATPRQLVFEANYAGTDGKPLLRRGALTRYP